MPADGWLLLGTSAVGARYQRMEKKYPTENTPPTPVSPVQDPKQQSDWATHKQTDEPWKGNPEKDQLPPDRPDIDLETWQESNTH